MKRLIFVRHGRAEEASALFPDFERSLSIKGKVVSEQMANLLAEKENNHGIFISSPAFRAYETALIFARVFKVNADDIIIRSSLYSHGSLSTFTELIEKLPDEISTIYLFGHNPAFTEIPDRLSKGGCDFMPKSGIVCLSFKTDAWNGIIHEKGKIEYFLKPDKTL